MVPKLSHSTYNISAGEPVTAGEMAAATLAAVPGAELVLEPGRGPGYRNNAHVNISRLVDETGFVPAFPVSIALADYVTWLRAGNEF